MVDPIAWYDAHAEEVSALYEDMLAEAVHAWLVDLLPSPPALILDVGAGSGRDAAWLAGKGYDVVAVEPSPAMRKGAEGRHLDSHIRWLGDRLPGLEQTLRLGLSFDFIVLSAVWIHLAPADRARAFRKLITLLKPGGVLAITLRHGPAEDARGLHPVSAAEIETLARNHGALVVRASDAGDRLGRKEIRWTQLAIRLPDDGTGALPLLRHIILNDDKSSTYKLALLRTLCRIADGAAGCARDAGEEHVTIPLGLAALFWIRLFKPLLAEGLPQSPGNCGDAGLGFVKEAFRQLSTLSHHDLRIGMRFSEETGAALHQALKDAVGTIARMPATYMTFPNGGPVLPVRRIGRVPRPHTIRLDEAYLASFGELHVPRHLWRALQRFDVWIEPALIAEWMRLIKVYGERQGRILDDAQLATAMAWSEPSRDVRLAREQAVRLIGTGSLFCVWSGRKLTQGSLDIDHCFPWSAWPCDDLWNLMPAHRYVNQREKRDRLPGDPLLRAARERIIAWWRAAYAAAPVLAERFTLEAAARLPGLERPASLDDIFSAARLQRMRLQHDQQVPEWSGPHR